jgi:hypothetical protein
MTDAVYDPGLRMFLNGHDVDAIRHSFARHRKHPTLPLSVGGAVSIQARRRMVKQGYAVWQNTGLHTVRRANLTEMGIIRLGRICGVTESAV